MSQRIPNIIHVVWFGKEMPKRLSICVDSWKENFPESDYQYMLWDEEKIRSEGVFDKYPFCRACFDLGYYPFVSDVVRLYALHTYGGVYMDTDVFVMFNWMSLCSGFDFVGTIENWSPWWINIAGSVLASVSWHPFLREGLNYYKGLSVLDVESLVNDKEFLIGRVLSRLAVGRGFRCVDVKQVLSDNMVLYPSKLFLHRGHAPSCTYHLCRGFLDGVGSYKSVN